MTTVGCCGTAGVSVAADVPLAVSVTSDVLVAVNVLEVDGVSKKFPGTRGKVVGLSDKETTGVDEFASDVVAIGSVCVEVIWTTELDMRRKSPVSAELAWVDGGRRCVAVVSASESEFENSS